MKVATSSSTFASTFARGELTQLEWLDLCANELEIDGVVFDAPHFARLDSEYLAQLKKCAVDLGLTVAAVAADETLDDDGERWLDVASALGAPLLVAQAPAASSDVAAWGAFTQTLKARASQAKRANVTLALRDTPETLCSDASDLVRASKDVDSAWLRYALDARALAPSEDDGRERHLAKAAIAVHRIQDLDTFARDADDEAEQLVRGLARFRGFLMLDAADVARGTAYHEAIARFTALRAMHLARPAAGRS